MHEGFTAVACMLDASQALPWTTDLDNGSRAGLCQLEWFVNVRYKELVSGHSSSLVLGCFLIQNTGHSVSYFISVVHGCNSHKCRFDFGTCLGLCVARVIERWRM